MHCSVTESPTVTSCLLGSEMTASNGGAPNWPPSTSPLSAPPPEAPSSCRWHLQNLWKTNQIPLCSGLVKYVVRSCAKTSRLLLEGDGLSCIETYYMNRYFPLSIFNGTRGQWPYRLASNGTMKMTSNLNQASFYPGIYVYISSKSCFGGPPRPWLPPNDLRTTSDLKF